MIKDYRTYKEYREKEKSKRSLKFFFYPEPTQIFLKWLRRIEWHYNAKGVLHKLFFLFSYHFYRKISLKTGFSIPRNVCASGLSLPHYGSIVINANSRIGENCRIQNNVNIGATGGSNKAPKIGNNVYIGPGAVLYGDIEIADNCYVGANEVVNKSFVEPYSVIVGMPAKVIKIETKAWNEK